MGGLIQVFKIPIKVPSWNQIIGKNHWTIKRIKDEIKEETFVALKKQKIQKVVSYPVTLHFRALWKYNKPRDVDNICCKYVLDSMVENGVLRTDDTTSISQVILEADIGCKEDVLFVRIIEP